eukprot:gnl/TRDRNA2_/TRDRNA2_82755_c0_seq1.p1 gnl/TRDRNA2_/TRDRNA2_82755_c0~~gnl/TRDRNA2_/TRDRNA2_82755_c0_seq1.p1  ORF type:complete len:279 (+),score=72.18 gnl/TRDRNA2_/TRDRNA2_82755_c0_seq1:87-839(+)
MMHAVPAAGAPGPGEGLTPQHLKMRWKELGTMPDALGFYGHGPKAGDYACFSNFFDQSKRPFEFEVPAKLFAFEIKEQERKIPCDFSEKAIMLCKAAAMGDKESFFKLRGASNPASAKKMGREVKGFNQALWDRVMCSVAFEVVLQKFAKTPELAEVLLKTGDRLIAEATRNDKIWGIGIDVGDPRVNRPSEWQGTNVLGWALMEARAELKRASSGALTPSMQAEKKEEEFPSLDESSETVKKRRWGKPY